MTTMEQVQGYIMPGYQSASGYPNSPVSDDSGDNHDGASSTAEELTQNGVVSSISSKAGCGVSSKQSAASSSGKGSSTGTSPTGGSASLNGDTSTTRSPKRAPTTQFHAHAPTNLTNRLEGKAAPDRVPAPSTSSTLGTASNASMYLPLGNEGMLTPTASNTSMCGSVDVSQVAMTLPPQPPPTMFPCAPGATQMMVSSSGVMCVPSSNGQPAHNPPLYTMTVGNAADHLYTKQQAPPPPLLVRVPTSHGTHQAGSSHAGSVHAAPQTGGTSQSNGRLSLSPAEAHSSANPLPQHTQAAQTDTALNQQHTIYVHVNAGETLSVRVGTDVQHIPGPATVRMVSQNSLPPTPLPLHVPQGHVVQQILDDNNVLKHIILSPSTGPPMGSPFYSGVAGTSSSSQQSTGANNPPTAQASAPFVLPPQGSSATPPPFAVSPYSQPPPHLPPFLTAGPNAVSTSHMPPIMLPPVADYHECVGMPQNAEVAYQPTASNTGSAGFGTGAVQQQSTMNNQLSAPAPVASAVPVTRTWTNHKHKRYNNNTNNANATNNTANDNNFTSAEFVDETAEPEESRSSASAVDDEEIEKLKEMLGRVQPVQIVSVCAREAVIAWQPLDTSEASSSGGPFPQIDASEFTYEVKLSEHKIHNVFKSYAVLANELQATNQLRVHEDIKPATEYYVRLQASLGERGLVGEPSMPVHFASKPCEPDRPVLPRLGKRTRNTLQVTWRRPHDNGGPVLKYTLECCQVQGNVSGEYSAAYTGPNEMFQLKRLAANSQYGVRVFAHNAHGCSAPSEVLYASTTGAPPAQPAPPSLQSATPTGLQLSWHKRTGDDRFTLQLEDPQSGHGFLNSAVTVDSSCWVNNLRRNEAYNLRLVASSDDGDSPPSDVVTYSTTAALPAAPKKPALKSGVRANSAHVVWDAPADTGGAEVTGYVLELQSMQKGEWKPVFRGQTRSHTLHELQPGTVYQVRVCCQTAAGQSPASDPLHITTNAVPPDSCSKMEVTRVKSNTATVKWAAPDCSGGADVSEYELVLVECSSAPASPSKDTQGQTIYKGSKLEHTTQSLLPGRKYVCRVRAHNCAGAGQWCESAAFRTTAAPPQAPSQLQCAMATHNSVKLTWHAPEHNNGAAVTEYKLMKCTLKRNLLECVPTMEDSASQPSSANTDVCHATECLEYSFVCSSSGGGTTHTVSGLQSNTLYSFVCVAVNACGQSAESSAVQCSTLPGPPSAPTNVQCEAQSTQEIQVSWTGAEPNGLQVQRYQVQCVAVLDTDSAAKGHVCTAEVSAEHNAVLVADLQPETVYKMSVRAQNECAWSAWSSTERCATLALPPAAPQLELVQAAHNSLKLKWVDTKSTNTQSTFVEETFTYTLEMQNKAGTFSPAYDGTSKSSKIQRLAECSEYHFRVRAVSSSGGAGPWSPTVAFSTTRTPPPSLKQAPRVTQVSANVGSWQVEWVPHKANVVPAGDKLQYCLQLAVANISPRHNAQDDWKTVYEGASQSFVLAALSPGQAHKVRVLCVRLAENAQGQMDKVYGAPTTAAMFNSAALAPPSRTRTASASASADSSLDSEDLSSSAAHDTDKRALRLTETQWAALGLSLFAVLAVLLAWLVSSFLEPVTPSTPS